MDALKERDLTVDVVKGIGIICVILGHINYGGYFYHIVYPFHMPLFFFISGWLLNDKYPPCCFFLRRGKKLLLPYSITCFFVFILSVILFLLGINYSAQYPNSPLDALIRFVYASGSIYNRTPFHIGTVGAVWFLPAVLISTCFVRCVLYVHKVWQQVVIVLIAFLVSVYSAKWVWLPFSIQAAGSASVFVYCGWVLKNYGTLRVDIRKRWVLFSVVGTAAWNYEYFFSIFVEISRAEYYLFIITVPFAVLICISILLISSKISRNISICRILCFWGQNSLVVLCFHSFLRCFLTRNIYHFLAPAGTPEIVLYFIVFVIHILFCGFGVIVSKHVKSHFYR